MAIHLFSYNACSISTVAITTNITVGIISSNILVPPILLISAIFQFSCSSKYNHNAL
ncbi:MAG: hypothetical protein HQK91_10425 [Nitrospirae bacterium]|nr:hypothetical protein [Nitrospirota bacterium]